MITEYEPNMFTLDASAEKHFVEVIDTLPTEIQTIEDKKVEREEQLVVEGTIATLDCNRNQSRNQVHQETPLVSERLERANTVVNAANNGNNVASGWISAR